MAVNVRADDGGDDARANDTLPQDRGCPVTRLGSRVTAAAGSFTAVVVAVLVTVVWLVGGLVVPGGYANNSYLLLMSTVASVVTFVMVFVIQYSRNRDSRATQARLDAVAGVLATVVNHGSRNDSEYRPNRLAGQRTAWRARLTASRRMRGSPTTPRTNRPEAG